MEETKTNKEIGLLDSVQLFAETMDAKFFSTTEDNKRRSMILIASEDGKMSSVIYGQGKRIIGSVAETLKDNESFNNMMTMAFIAANGMDIVERLMKARDEDVD